MEYFFILLKIMFSLAVLKVGIDHFRKLRQERVNRESTAPPRPVAQPLGAEAFADPGRNWQQKPPPPPPKKPWWRLYGGALFIFLGGVIHISLIAWFVRGNPPPLFEELHMQQVQVLGWQRTHPQLHVRLPDGHSRMVEFPTLRLGKGGDLYYVLSFDEQRQLVDQTCQMWGRPLRFSIQDSYQVFALECDKGGRLSFGEVIKDYKSTFDISSSSTFSILIPGWLFTLLITFWALSVRNRKERLALQTPSSSISSSKAQP